MIITSGYAVLIVPPCEGMVEANCVRIDGRFFDLHLAHQRHEFHADEFEKARSCYRFESNCADSEGCAVVLLRTEIMEATFVPA